MARSSVLVTVSSDLAGRRAPFVYLGFARNCRAVYLGETMSSNGVLGRMAQHLSETSSNTFKQRVCACLGYDEVRLDDIYFIGVPLSSYKGFWLDTNEYRRAVEYLIQLKLLNFIAEAKLKVALTSRVNANGYTATKVVQNEAEIVAGRIFERLKEIA